MADVTVPAGPGTAGRATTTPPWWRPGVVVAAGAFVVVTVVTAAWYAYSDGGCGNPGAKFACLVEAFVALVAALVLGPLVLWWGLRRAGVGRAFLSSVVACVVAFLLLALAALLDQVRLLTGYEVPYTDRPGVALIGAWLALAALAGGLALQGPRRRLRAAAAAVGLLALVVATFALQQPADRARDGLALDRAQAPLLLPDGWQAHGVSVSEDGGLSYDAVPEGWDGYGIYGLDVQVGGDVARLGDSCSYRACTDVGDVRAEVPEDGGMTAWRVVDGYLVTVTRYSSGPDGVPVLDPVTLLQGLVEVDREEFLDRRFSDRVAAGSADVAVQRT